MEGKREREEGGEGKSKKMKKERDWSKLGFDYVDNAGHVFLEFQDGKWGERPGLKGSPLISLHVGATAFHYGQACFEGLKAFSTKDGNVSIFRPLENARRLARSCERLMMPPISEELFLESVELAVSSNIDDVPPYGKPGSLYIRPVVFATGPSVSLKPSLSYLFLVIVTPVGNYYKEGPTPVSAMVMDEFDRAAPLGLGSYKVAGNYAGAMYPNEIAVKQGHPITLYLDPIEHKYIEEFNSSNFVAVTKDGTFVTPLSSSILPSITNKSLMELARDEGMKVEERKIDFEKEIETFAEVGAVGTAVIITPINKIVRGDKVYHIGGHLMGPHLRKLYDRLSAIRVGEEEDKFGWNHILRK